VFDKLDNFEGGKKLNHGGGISINQTDLIDNGGLASDFTSLVRNAILYKLVGNLGLKSSNWSPLAASLYF
jgi:hypothetical protein